MNKLIWPLHIFVVAGQLCETQIYFPSDGNALWGSETALSGRGWKTGLRGAMLDSI